MRRKRGMVVGITARMARMMEMTRRVRFSNEPP
jgi:hypothetical protein